MESCSCVPLHLVHGTAIVPVTCVIALPIRLIKKCIKLSPTGLGNWYTKMKSPNPNCLLESGQQRLRKKTSVVWSGSLCMVRPWHLSLEIALLIGRPRTKGHWSFIYKELWLIYDGAQLVKLTRLATGLGLIIYYYLEQEATGVFSLCIFMTKEF